MATVSNLKERLPVYNFPTKFKVPVVGETIECVLAGSGEATVVLVNGSGGPIEGWHKVFGPIAAFSKVFAYNRPGIGGSSQPKVPQVGSTMVNSLQASLLAVNLPPPYVLVGHSLGGLIVNLFACLYPSQVSAVVFIEATVVDDVAVMAMHENAVQRFMKSLLDKIAPANPNAETEHVQKTVRELRLAPPFPAVPLTVVTGGKPALAWATPAKSRAARAAHQRRLVDLSPLGKQVIARRSGHFPQFTEPELIIAAIEESINPDVQATSASGRGRH